MKYWFSIWVAFSFLISSCQISGGDHKQQDSILSVNDLKNKDNGSNLVSSEAPDAVAKVIQGYALPKFDDGMAQSPINIISDSALTDSSQFSSIRFNAGVTAIENLGHTIQLDFKDGSTTATDGKIYFLKQFHFHTPSEHMIDGMTFPMEMHMVNVLKDSGKKDGEQFLVIAFLFKMGHENRFIKEFLSEIPAHEEKDSLLSGTVQLEDLISTIPET